MERFGLTLGRVVLIVAATVATLALLIATDAAAPAWVGAAVVLLATGLIVNRVWAAALPFAVAVAWIAFAFIAYGTQDGSDYTWEQMAMFLVAVAAGVSVCLLVGVGLRRAGRAGRASRADQRSDFSPQ